MKTNLHVIKSTKISLKKGSMYLHVMFFNCKIKSDKIC